MKTSSLLRTVSSKLSARLSPSSVAPWPPLPTRFDRWLTSELDELRPVHPNLYATAAWLSKSLDVAISAQLKAMSTIQSAKVDEKVLDAYMDDVVSLLDACNVVRCRIEEIRTYTGTLVTALRCLEGEREPSSAAALRAKKALESCAAMERRCAELDTCGSSLRKIGERLAAQDHCGRDESEVFEIVNGSRAVALLAISMASIALSFRSRRGVPTVCSSKGNKGWGSLLSEMQREAKDEFEKRRRDGVAVVLEELKVTVSTARRLRGLVSGGESGGEVRRSVVSELRRRCGELEEGLRPLEERVDGLYRGLIDVRMCLLGVISQS